MVHRRELDGEVLIFGNQGALLGNAMTWWDHGTGSVWSQPLGEAVAGPRKGDRLDLFPSTFTTWKAWSDEHPETMALDAPGGFDRTSLRDVAIVVNLGDDTAAYPLRFLQDVLVVNDVVGGVKIAVVLDPTDPSRWVVFSRTLDDGSVMLAVDGSTIVDIASGTVFDPVRGIGRGGVRDGEILDLLPSFTSFPEDIPTFWPGARVWTPPH